MQKAFNSRFTHFSSMPSEVTSERQQVYQICSAVFSQKPSVSAKRIAILQAINMCSEGKMKFRDILREIQSKFRGVDYTSEKLTYDLRVLRKHGLINQASDGKYTITQNGCSLIDMYQEIVHRISEPRRHRRTGFAGEVNGHIKVVDFDLVSMEEKLARLPFFRKKFIASKDRVCLELKDDDDNFASDIQIQEGGHFSIRVVLFRDDQDRTQDFLGDFEKSEEWYETARAITQTIAYYIRRVAKTLWKDAEIDLPLKPDSYPV
jgi:predicted transcriptional regulator